MQKIVIKLGSSSLTGGTKKLFRPFMVELARQIAAVQAENAVVVVSSGAVAAGKELLTSFASEPNHQAIPSKQMFAAVGQARLMQVWGDLFNIYGITIGQVLLTRFDFSNAKSHENAKNTFERLLAHRILPIVNENDSVATDEIALGDNDNLSALVASLVGADLLILLTDQEGVYTADPRIDRQATLIRRVEKVDDHLLQIATGSKHEGSIGTGGMRTKIEAARFATEHGVRTVIAKAYRPDVILDVVAGKEVGTEVLAQ